MANNTIKRRKESTEKYIDAILDNNSKICGVRVDLKYKQEFAKDVTLDVINKDLKRMLDNRRNNKTIFGNNLGYIIKKEVTINVTYITFLLLFLFISSKSLTMS